MPHPDEGLIHAWLDGELAPEDATRVAALVDSNPAWARAAADARGVTAAATRIVGALDRGAVRPRGNVARPRESRLWMMRAAAVLLVMVSAGAIVRRQWTSGAQGDATATTGAARRSAEQGKGAALASGPQQKPAAAGQQPAPDSRLSQQPPSAAASNKEQRLPNAREQVATVPRAALSAPTRGNRADLERARQEPVAVVPAESAAFRVLAERKRVAKSEAPSAAAALDKVTTTDTIAGQDSRQRLAALGLTTGRAVPAPSVSANRAVPAQGGAVSPPPTQAESRRDSPTAAVRCFRMVVPPDSSHQFLRLSVAALGDSVRLGVLTLRGDTLVGRNRLVLAHSITCPAP